MDLGLVVVVVGLAGVGKGAWWVILLLEHGSSAGVLLLAQTDFYLSPLLSPPQGSISSQFCVYSEGFIDSIRGRVEA